jgi:hypothetical protein
MDNILSLFHHIHHKDGIHSVHHCGGRHKEIEPKLDYTIEHCSCGKHRIDKEFATGHGIDADLGTPEIKIKFLEKCPDGGWHIESGIKQQE